MGGDAEGPRGHLLQSSFQWFPRDLAKPLFMSGQQGAAETRLSVVSGPGAGVLGDLPEKALGSRCGGSPWAGTTLYSYGVAGW